LYGFVDPGTTHALTNRPGGVSLQIVLIVSPEVDTSGQMDDAVCRGNLDSQHLQSPDPTAVVISSDDNVSKDLWLQ